MSQADSGGGDMCVPAAILVGSSENLRLGVRRMERTCCKFFFACCMLSRAPSRRLRLMFDGENRFLADGDGGIIEVVFVTLTVCDCARAAADLVGVMNLERRGSAVCEVILRGGTGSLEEDASVLLSRDSGRVVAASSTSVRLTRFGVGLFEPSWDEMRRTVECERGKLEFVKSTLDCVRFNGVGGILPEVSATLVLG